MKQNGKTIKQIAEEIGVSKQAVRKKITPEIGNKYTVTVGNTAYISDKGEDLIKSAFNKQDGNHVTSNKTVTVTELVTTLQEELKAKTELINGLTNELAKEREHSREQSDKIAILADQAQKLQLAQISSSEPKLLSDGAVTSEDKPTFKDRLKHLIKGKR